LLQREFAVPEEFGQFGEAFGDLLDEGHDHRDQPRRQPPVDGVRLGGLVEPEAELLQFFGWGDGRGLHAQFVSMFDKTGQEEIATGGGGLHPCPPLSSVLTNAPRHTTFVT
jgi:hypothetical protein